MKKRIAWLSTALILAMASLGTVSAPAQESVPVKVGVVPPLTGTQRNFGEIQKNSFLMGKEEINAAGGIHGRPIELVIEDDQSTIAAGRSAVEKLILQDKVTVLTGGYSSDVTFAMAAVAQHRKVPLLVTTGERVRPAAD
ncbi:MAG: ABC transporter substrate-binding protein [Desulfobacterales bacterium]|nr:ABC transporter substrate-binding protein [Desulfobacterales bacterium]